VNKSLLIEIKEIIHSYLKDKIHKQTSKQQTQIEPSQKGEGHLIFI